MIVITTDFGDRFSLVQIVGVIKSIHPSAQIMIGENRVTPFSIVEGAFVILKSSKFLPNETIHLGIIDPGVGGVRKPIIIQGKKFFYVGPDNGLFWPAVEDDGLVAAYEIDMKLLGTSSSTFHGRDVFAKVAAYVAENRPFSEYSKPLSESDLVKLNFKKNQVVFIDPYGNIKINNPATYEIDQQITVKSAHATLTMPFKRTFVDVPIGKPVAYKGSNDVLEVAIHQASASTFLGINVEDVLEIEPS